RWYDLQTGQWMSEDPTGILAGDYNLRRYVGNNASNLTDPSGLAAAPPGLPVVALTMTLDKAPPAPDAGQGAANSGAPSWYQKFDNWVAKNGFLAFGPIGLVVSPESLVNDIAARPTSTAERYVPVYGAYREGVRELALSDEGWGSLYGWGM